MVPRVYDVEPKDGERSGFNYRCYVAGKVIPGVFRIELDEDADEGFATVHAFFNIADGGKWEAIVDVTGESAVKLSFRHYVYVGHKDSIDAEAVDRTTFRHLPKVAA